MGGQNMSNDTADSSAPASGSGAVNGALMKLRFQNYTPRSEELKKYCDKSVDPNALLQEIIESQDTLIKTTNMKFADPALDLDNLVPRKANWEMKNKLAPKLEILEERTKKAILKMVREKAAQQGQLNTTEDLAGDLSDIE